MSKTLPVPKDSENLPLAIVKQMLSLVTSGFGLVAALAWNELVKKTIETYLEPYLPKDSEVISLLIYAVLVTALAVIITLQLTKLQSALEQKKRQK